MANLFWKTKRATSSLLATPFKTEEEFETLVFNTPQILEDIFLLKRQIRGGSKRGIPDILGVDSDGNICIIEMKNVAVDAAIISQVLEYAFWAEHNPDSIKNLWHEAQDKPEDVSINWEDYQVRIIVIAPSILRSTMDLVGKIGYPVDLIEVKRWAEGANSFLLVNRLEQEKSPKGIVKGMETYDAAYYSHHHNKNSAKEFMKYVEELDGLVRRKAWTLDKKFNKNYCSFKAGFFNAFGIGWIGSKTFALFVRLPDAEAKKVGPKWTKYQTQWKQAEYYIEPGRTKLRSFLPLLEAAYRKLTGD